MSSNERQVGGEHYKGLELQHWDFVELNGYGYLEGCASKYVARWRSKNGLQDLEKALHYVDKLIELHTDHSRDNHGSATAPSIVAFCRAYELTSLEQDFMFNLFFWNELKDLENARRDLLKIIEQAK